MSVPISGNHWHGRRKKDPLSLLRAALSYSGRRLLSLRMDDSGRWFEDYDMEALEVSESLFNILLSQSQRWKSVILSISPGLFQLLPFLRGRIPELEAFNICLDWLADVDDEITGTFDALAIAPRLKHLVLEDWGSDLIPVIDASASHLVTFCDDRQVTDRAGTLHQGIIRDAPSLEKFSVGYQRPREGALPAASPCIVHQALRNLTVCEDAILRSLDLPNLASATIQACSSPWDAKSSTYQDVLPALLNLIIRSGCILTSLTIADTQLNDHIFSILSLCPNLTKLDLCCSRWQESDPGDAVLQTVIERMAETTTIDSHKLVLVPLLKDFTVSMFDPDLDIEDDAVVGFINSAFVRMLKVRLDCKSPLWSIRIYKSSRHLIFSMLDQEDIQQLKVWKHDRKLDISMDI
ncbi:hypothetical protein ARMSODRAFT_1020924 [Armillaria solidipes]|uniref:F-box domain-containing protein n=1 Tax=Armillaria solidipes TaxID=1076256 RepID=A0A2H3BSU6_9AGAR|nr:hypothetical protein ARMSODRAFT_1020924 [Armillaria solidipes]